MSNPQHTGPSLARVCTRPGCHHDRGSHWDGDGQCGWCECATFATEAAGPVPLVPQPAPVPGEPDPVAILGQLGAIWSDDFDAYAGGELDASKLHCALCQCAPCRCPAFGTPAYFALIDARHGRRSSGPDRRRGES